MIALISPAKTMSNVVSLNISGTTARFMSRSEEIVKQMQRYSEAELQEIFKVSPQIAYELRSRFRLFFDELEEPLPAVDAYNGVVYKHFKDAVKSSNIELLQKTVRISSLLYGLLRPTDLIKPYRMEGFVRLAGSDTRIDRYWRDIQTECLIEDVKNSGGTLLYLASKEEQNAFNWKEVKKAVNLIDVQFLVQKGDKLRQIVVYTKMARGEMLRYILENNITHEDSLKTFEWEGYRFNYELSTPNKWVWLMQ